MIKKISIYLILIFFSTNVVAQDLIMKCGEFTYKYISDPSGDKVLFKHSDKVLIIVSCSRILLIFLGLYFSTHGKFSFKFIY